MREEAAVLVLNRRIKMNLHSLIYKFLRIIFMALPVILVIYFILHYPGGRLSIASECRNVNSSQSAGASNTFSGTDCGSIAIYTFERLGSKDIIRSTAPQQESEVHKELNQ